MLISLILSIVLPTIWEYNKMSMLNLVASLVKVDKESIMKAEMSFRKGGQPLYLLKATRK
ncbi:hypothetical protein CK203_081683 [Vitis vinifera]|uniref:Uncharacterized protein n=1 Tax=Vitis vinifera TaxID=29760 RepID=A0A438DPN2_VITVI|nr:hypothetical protein CK203_081683 [Vitis vinifera]